MKKDKSTYDIFLSYSSLDQETASNVVRVLESFDLKVFYSHRDIKTGDRLESTLWDAMAESYALVILISEDGLASNTALELGAAKAWSKPIFALAESSTLDKVRLPLDGVAVYPLNRIDEIAHTILESYYPLQDNEVESLRSVYKKVGIPLDQLFTSYNLVNSIALQFNHKVDKNLSGEQILRHLVRMRKTGILGSAARKKTKIA